MFLDSKERDIVKRLLAMCAEFDDSFEYRKLRYENRKGAYDLLLGFPCLSFNIMVETKRPKGGFLSPHQLAEGKFLHAIGINTCVISTIDDITEFKAALEGLALKKFTPYITQH